MENKTIRHWAKKLELKQKINAKETKLTIVLEEVTA